MSQKESDKALAELCKMVKQEMPELNLERIKRAYNFAKKAHAGQFRMSGEPYIQHPVETAKILLELHADEDTIIAGLLHDVPEDTEYDIDDVRTRFGKHVAQLVYALTKLSKVYYKYSMTDRQVESLQKMFLETAEDVRVIIIKLSDRLHNMRTLNYLRPDKQQRIAKETLQIYAPLANLFGIYQLRRQLEDLCFFYLQPEEYSRIDDFVHEHEKNRREHIEKTVERLNKVLKKAGIPAELEGRPKHYYSIYQKMVRDQKVLQDIYDYYAIRILTNTVENCYLAVGKIHEAFKPKPGRFKDYIALPKPNGYQSIHTTVIGFQGKLTEIQIRTEEMHSRAEFGVAAHFLYKENKNTYLEKSIQALKNLKNPGKFIEGLQGDILRDRIYVFTPTGETIDLPQGATCLDFIYASGMPIDNQFKALVNGKSYSITGELSSGDNVDIIYSKKKLNGPELWWLDHVKSTLAKEKLTEYFQNKSMAKKVELGEKILQRKLDYENQGLIYQIPPSRINKVLKKFNIVSFELLLSKIGEGSINANEVYKELFPDIQIGFWTFAKRTIIRVAKKLSSNSISNEKYKIRIRIDSYDRKGILKEVINPFYELNLPIVRIKGKGYDVNQTLKSTLVLRGKNEDPVHNFVGRDYIDVLVENHEQLISLFDKLESIPGVIRVQRVFRHKQIGFVLVAFLATVFWVSHPFIMEYLSHSEHKYTNFFHGISVYLALFMLMGITIWVKNVGNKTFPHFEETRFFWPLSFGLITLATIALFVEKMVMNLALDLKVMSILAALTFGFFAYNYFSDEKIRRRHLNRLKEGTHSYQDKNPALEK